VRRAIPLSSLLLAAACSCGGAAHPAAGPPPSRDRDASITPDRDPVGQIASLSAELHTLAPGADGNRCAAGPPVDHPDGGQPNGDDTATEVCDVRDRICALAERVPGNAWATDKCRSARRSCRLARGDCPPAALRPEIF